MKNIILITDVNFWLQGAGHRTRILALIKVLAKQSRLTVAYIGIEINYSETYLSNLLNIKFIYLNKRKSLNQFQYAAIVKKLFRRYDFDVCIVEYIHNYYFLKVIPQEVITVLDAHDIISERTLSFKEFTFENVVFDMPEDTEYLIYECFDYVILICDIDYQKVAIKIPNQKLILAPHHADIKQREIRCEVANVGFIGSEYYPNVDAINFFIKEIWPSFSETNNINFNIYGNVAHRLNFTTSIEKRIFVNGFIPDINVVYNEIDIVINPVRFGAGLKIKNIEALANGLPLITTTHGSRGIASGIDKAFLVADNPNEFKEKLIDLTSNFKFRLDLSKSAYDYMKLNFSEELCFKQLLHNIL